MTIDPSITPADIQKLAARGVRPEDAAVAGLRRINSSTAASLLGRTDKGDLPGILIEYPPMSLERQHVSHCRVLLDELYVSVSKERINSTEILQPTLSHNHLYFIPSTPEENLLNPRLPVLFCDSELSALATRSFNLDSRGFPLFLTVGGSGYWGHRSRFHFPDFGSGETVTTKGPVPTLRLIAAKNREFVLCFASDTTANPEACAGRDSLRKFLRGRGVKVSILEIPTAENGSRQDLGQWVANAGEEVVVAAIQQARIAPAAGPAGGPIEVSEAGIFRVTEKGKVFLASPFRVTGVTRDFNGGGWGRLIEIPDPDVGTRTMIISMSNLAGDSSELAETLGHHNVTVNPARAARDQLALWVQQQNSPDLFFTTPRVGWHGRSFVLPNHVFGPDDAAPIMFCSGRGVQNRYQQKGSIKDWTERIGRRCIGNSRLVFAVAAAFAGPLLLLVDQESGGFHFRGASSTGKTTALTVAGSVWGGGPKGFLRSWRATSNGMEAIAELHNDCLLCLDEFGQVTPQEAGQVAYMLSNGVGKVRMTREVKVRPSAEWQQIFLSTGEISLADHMMSAGRQVRAGQEVRMLDITADAGQGLGLFEQLHDCATPDEFANTLSLAVSECYGSAAIAYLERLVNEAEQVSTAAKGFIEKFLTTHVERQSAGEVFRAARRFALVAFGGEYASSLGITGWEEGESSKATFTCFRAWLERRGTLGAGDTEAALAQVRHFLTMYGSSRFETICADDEQTVERGGVRDRVGFRLEVADEESAFQSNDGQGAEEGAESKQFVYYVLPEAFRREICKGFDPGMVARALRDQEHLESNEKDRLTYQKRLPGMGRQRVYCIRPSIFQVLR